MSSIESQAMVANMPKYIDGLSFNGNGQLSLVASSLTGRCWNGLIAVFNDPKYAPNVPHIDYASPNEAGCTDVSWIDDDRIVVSTDAGTVEVWQLKDAPLMENCVMLSEHNDVCCSISVSKFSKQIVSASWDGLIKLWDLEVDLSIHSIRVHLDKVLDVSWNTFTADLFASSSEDGSVKLYDNRACDRPVRQLFQCDESFPKNIDWINETQVCVGSSSGNLLLLDARKCNTCISTVRAHSKAINNVLCFNGIVASVADDMLVKAYQINNWEQLYSDKRHSDYVMGLALNKQDGVVWSSSWDGCVLAHNIMSQTDVKMNGH